MKTGQALVAALVSLPQWTFASFAETPEFISTRDAEPHMQYDLNTIRTCTWWYDNYEDRTCTDVRDLMYIIRPSDFSRWNPSITLDCGNWQYLSYCVQVKNEEIPASTSSATFTSFTTSTTSATATTTLNAPAATETKAWQFLGCYKDLFPANAHTLKDQHYVGNNLTIGDCQTTCKADGYLYAGVENGEECWCGNDIQAADANVWVPATDCDAPCTGNDLQVCGAKNRVFVYKNVVPVVTWTGLGCYGEEDPPILRNQLETAYGAANNTRQNCISTCDRAGYAYAGVGLGQECWCDNIINTPGTLAVDGAAGCNMTCTGNATEMCGGVDRVNVFTKSTNLTTDGQGDQQSQDGQGGQQSQDDEKSMGSRLFDSRELKRFVVVLGTIMICLQLN